MSKSIPHLRHPTPHSACTSYVGSKSYPSRILHKHPFPSGIHHKSSPQEISTLISWVSADISTASPFCKAGIFVSSSWVLHRMMCPMCPGSIYSNFNWRLLTWSKPGNQSLRAATICHSPKISNQTHQCPARGARPESQDCLVWALARPSPRRVRRRRHDWTIPSHSRSSTWLGPSRGSKNFAANSPEDLQRLWQQKHWRLYQAPNTCSFRTRSTSCKQNDESRQHSSWNTPKADQ